MWFRVFLAVAGLLGLILVSWLSTHTSSAPQILGRWSAAYTSMLAVILSAAAGSLMLSGPWYSRVHSWRREITLLLIGSVFSLSFAEFSIRSLDLFGMSYYRQASRYHRAKLPDPDLYYVHEPNSVNSYQNIEVRINSLGMRDREVLNKQLAEYRVLFLGDSVTFGWGVDENDTFVRRFETLLADEIDGPVRALNAGVGSYNTQNELAFLERYGEQIKPDLVILMFVNNDLDVTPDEPFDPYADSRLAEKSPPQIVRWFLGHSWLYRTFVHFGRYGRARPAQSQEAVLTSREWIASGDALRTMAQWCKQNESEFIVYLTRLEMDPVSNAIAAGLRAISLEMGFPVFDTQPWFAGKDIRQITNSIVDSHPNSQGHSLLARGIVSSLIRTYFRF